MTAILLFYVPYGIVIGDQVNINLFKTIIVLSMIIKVKHTVLQSWEKFKNVLRGFLLGVKCLNSYCDEITNNCQLSHFQLQIKPFSLISTLKLRF